MNPKNYFKNWISDAHVGSQAYTDLQERVLLLGLEPVGAKELETAGSLGLGETLLGTLQKREDIVEDNGL